MKLKIIFFIIFYMQPTQSNAMLRKLVSTTKQASCLIRPRSILSLRTLSNIKDDSNAQLNKELDRARKDYEKKLKIEELENLKCLLKNKPTPEQRWDNLKSAAYFGLIAGGLLFALGASSS